MELSEQHFNDIARDYDYWKKKNFFYYDNLKELFRSLIPRGASVLEIGCGTGDILAALSPAKGKGIDISTEMIRLAEIKHRKNKALLFSRADIFNEQEQFEYDYILLVDVLEHVENLSGFLKKIASLTPKGSKVVISVANPLWEPVLMVAEKFGMKMPEGPHKRYTIDETETMMDAAGFSIVDRNYRLLVPKKTFFSDWFNKRFYKNRLLQKFGFVIFWVLQTK